MALDMALGLKIQELKYEMRYIVPAGDQFWIVWGIKVLFFLLIRPFGFMAVYFIDCTFCELVWFLQFLFLWLGFFGFIQFNSCADKMEKYCFTNLLHLLSWNEATKLLLFSFPHKILDIHSWLFQTDIQADFKFASVYEYNLTWRIFVFADRTGK